MSSRTAAHRRSIEWLLKLRPSYRSAGCRRGVVGSVLPLLAATLVVAPALRAASRPPVRAKNGMVVTASPPATAVGVEILRFGGNAVDAAVAVGFALAVTYPTAGNLGGGGFMIVHLAERGENWAIDYREKAPAAAHRDLYLDDDGTVVEGLSTEGHLSVAVPGTVAGLLLALETYGTLERRTVLQPAIRLAREGFPVNRALALSLAQSAPRLEKHPETRRIFLRDGELYGEREIFRQPELAEALERIAANGLPGFYRGRTADLLVAEMARGSGLITLDDLQRYEPKIRKPIESSYRGNRLVSMPPPSSGGTVLAQMLNFLEPLDLSALGHSSSAYVHTLAAAMKRAFADRAEHMGDPDFVSVPVAGLTAKSYARKRWEDFDPERTKPALELGAGAPWPDESEETTHFSVVDKDGNAVSNTYTLNYSYGSAVTVTGGGFLLNNIMDNFSSKTGVPNGYGLIQGEANSIAAGKRPLSSMTPSMLLDEEGGVRLVVGTPGGPTIINTVLQVIVNIIDHGFTVQEAVDAPRFHHQWLPDRIQHEPRALVADVVAALEARGHEVKLRSLIGDAHAILVDKETGVLEGGADPRRGGVAEGY